MRQPGRFKSTAFISDLEISSPKNFRKIVICARIAAATTPTKGDAGSIDCSASYELVTLDTSCEDDGGDDGDESAVEDNSDIIGDANVYRNCKPADIASKIANEVKRTPGKAR